DGLINTIAGTATPGFSGDSGPAAKAQINLLFNDLGSLALDPAGNLYLADSGNYRIRRIDGTSGIITTFFGPMSANDPPPRAVATDTAGNVYFESAWRIVKLSPSGQVLAAYGSGVSRGFSEDGTPAAGAILGNQNVIQGLVIDPAGNIIFADGTSARVR